MADRRLRDRLLGGVMVAVNTWATRASCSTSSTHSDSTLPDRERPLPEIRLLAMLDELEPLARDAAAASGRARRRSAPLSRLRSRSPTCFARGRDVDRRGDRRRAARRSTRRTSPTSSTPPARPRRRRACSSSTTR